MAERINYRQINEGRHARNWHSRFDDPMLISEPQPKTKYNSTPEQMDVDNAHRLDTAHASGDPMAFLEAQLAAMPQEAQSEIRAFLPQTGDIFSAE